VVNLRGKVIPIVDLRRRFGMAQEGAEETCIIVVQVRGIQIGIVVDRVSEVLDIATDQIEPPPSFGVDVDTEYLLGLAKSDGRVRLLLDIDRVLSAAETAELPAGQAE
jgi:purine-binding chemotaxis protein CheW